MSNRLARKIHKVSYGQRTLQEGLRQGLTCSFVGNHEEVQQHLQSYLSHQTLYDKATIAVLFNGSIEDWFQTTREVRQGLSTFTHPLHLFVKRIMTDALGNHESTVSAGDRTITNLRFADEFDGI